MGRKAVLGGWLSFRFILTSWICLPGPRPPLDCPGFWGSNQPARAPDLPW